MVNKLVRLNKETTDLINPAREVFLKNNKEFEGFKVSQDYIIRRALKYYIESW